MYNTSNPNFNLIKQDSNIKLIELNKEISGGENIESDEDLRKRLYFIVSNPEGVGTVTDYERWALEVDGVKVSKALPCFYGNGTVKVIIGGEYGSVLDDELVKKVQDYICPLGEKYGRGKAPIGSTATVTTFEKVPISISIEGLKIEDTYNLDIVKLKLEENIKEYLLKTTEVIIYHEIIGIVIESYGVKDFKELLVNGFKENITLNFDEKGILEEIVYDE